MIGVFVFFNAVIIGATIVGRIPGQYCAPILGAFNAGYGALSLLCFGYIWGETKRPHKSPLEIVKNIKI